MSKRLSYWYIDSYVNRQKYFRKFNFFYKYLTKKRLDKWKKLIKFAFKFNTTYISLAPGSARGLGTNS